MTNARVWAMLLGVALWLGAVAARAECTKDTDCEGERVCESGACVAPATAPPAASATPVPNASGTAPVPTAGAAPAAATGSAPGASPAAASMAKEPARLADDPAPTDEHRPRYKRRSRGLMVTGIVLTSVGSLALAVAILTSGARHCESDFDQTTCRTEPNYGAWVLTGVLLGAGIPALVVGGKKVPATNAPRAGLAPWVSRHGAGLGLELSL